MAVCELLAESYCARMMCKIWQASFYSITVIMVLQCILWLVELLLRLIVSVTFDQFTLPQWLCFWISMLAMLNWSIIATGMLEPI